MEFKMYWQKDIETMPRSQIEAIQLERLKHIVRYCYDKVEFYHDRLDKAGVNPDKIKQLSDIEYIPYTTKEDIRDHYPFGLFAVDKSFLNNGKHSQTTADDQSSDLGESPEKQKQFTEILFIKLHYNPSFTQYNIPCTTAKNK